jgi:hypothetical protein
LLFERLNHGLPSGIGDMGNAAVGMTAFASKM